MDCKVTGVRGTSTEVRSSRDIQGGTELWSTCVVRSRHPGSVLAFAYNIGGCVPGTGSELKSDQTDTNMRVPGQYVGSENGGMGKLVTGLEWSVPEVVSPRYLPKQGLAPYHVRLSDVSELLRKALVRFCVGGDRSVVDVHPGSRPVAWGWNGARQEVRFDRSLPIGRIERFWAEISFPGDPPIFGAHPEDQAWEASLPVVFRLLEDGSPTEKMAGILETASGVVRDLRKTIDDVSRYLPPPGMDPAMLAELAEMRKGCNTDAELVDLLRAVRQGIGTR